MPVNKYEKSSKSNNVLGKLLAYFLNEKGKAAVGIVFVVIGALMMLAAPLCFQKLSILILDALQVPGTKIPVEDIAFWGGLSGGLYIVGSILTYVQTYIVAGLVARGSQRLRNEMIKKFNRLPLNYFDTRNIGDILSYVSNDVDVISTTLNETLANLISSIVTLVGVLIILFVLDWRIALSVIILLPILIIILLKVGSVSQKFFADKSALTARVSSEAEESYTAFNIVRVFNATSKMREKFADCNYKLEKAMDKSDFYSQLMHPLTNLMSNALLCIVGLIGGVIAVKLGADSQSIATVVTAITYVNQLVSPLTTIAQTYATFQQAIAAADRIFAFLDEVDQPDESNKTVTVPEVKGNIEFEHVKFGYNPDRIIVHDFCEKGKAGQKIAIVGPTGAGKTTMVNLLMRFYELNSGSIKIEGIDTKTMNRSYVRSLFGMVLQDTWLFEGTIMENLKYSRPDATDEEVYAACKSTHCDEFIRQQPGGYQHILNEDCGLSAGQKQLLTIARAMVQKAPMLILDEATSSVDTRTELLIQDAMDALMKGHTSFVIAHRLSTIKNSDLIIVMKDGDVIETGNHDALMKKDGFYASLYNAQFTGKGPQFS